jgi:hypothetical protein
MANKGKKKNRLCFAGYKIKPRFPESLQCTSSKPAAPNISALAGSGKIL